MRELARSDLANFDIISLARWMVAAAPQHDTTEEIRLLHSLVRDQIRYVKDPSFAELIQTPSKTLEIGQGDCDDKSILLAALLESLGIKTRFVAVAFNDPHEPIFSHVLVEAKNGGEWVPLETTEPVAVGWYPAGVEKRMVCEL